MRMRAILSLLIGLLFCGSASAQGSYVTFTGVQTSQVGQNLLIVVQGGVVLDQQDQAALTLEVIFRDTNGQQIQTANLTWNPPTPGTGTYFSARSVAVPAGNYTVEAIYKFRNGMGQMETRKVEQGFTVPVVPAG